MRKRLDHAKSDQGSSETLSKGDVVSQNGSEPELTVYGETPPYVPPTWDWRSDDKIERLASEGEAVSQDDSKPENPFYAAWADSPINKEYVTTIDVEPMTAKRFMEIKRLVRDSNPHGLQPLAEYAENDAAYTESVMQTAFDKLETEYVPLTMYVNGERREIGRAKISGDTIFGFIESVDRSEMKDVISKNTLNGVSFGFHIDSFKGDYPGAKDISLDKQD